MLLCNVECIRYWNVDSTCTSFLTWKVMEVIC